MNERIKELAKQADVLVDAGENVLVGRYSIHGNYQSMEKFAELIVRECIETLGTFEDYWTHEQQMGELKKYFGVE